jgi:glycosyltransferase involved in cell wall biosynthesis
LKLSIIIPCYNEAGNIPLIVNRFTEILTPADDCEILLVNNGSTDNSLQIFDSELKRINDSRFRVVHVEKNKGYGFGILSGLNNAAGEALAWTHADMQTDPKDVFTAFKIYQQHNDLTVFVKGRRKSRAIVPQIFTWGMGVMASVALGETLEDIGAQPKLFSKQFYSTYLKEKAPYDFSLDLFAQYNAKKHGKIVEFPVYFAKRLYGEAKGGGSLKTRIKVTRRVFSFILSLRKQLKEGK